MRSRWKERLVDGNEKSRKSMKVIQIIVLLLPVREAKRQRRSEGSESKTHLRFSYGDMAATSLSRNKVLTALSLLRRCV
jgi:hypothetical protein